MNISAIIMASGFSNRMKKDKLKLKIDGREMYKYVVDLVSELDFCDKILVSNDKEIKDYAIENGLKALDNPNAYIGKSSSINIGVNSSSDSLGYLFFVADQPFLSKQSVIEITNKFLENPDKITIPFYGGKRGAPMLFPISYKEDLLKLKDDEGGILLIPGNEINRVEIEDEREHFDIDTPSDYENI